MHHIQTLAGLEHLAGKMQDGAVAGGPVGELAGLRFHQRRQFLHASGRRAGVHDQHQWRRGHQGNGGEVLDGVVGKFGIQTGIDGVGGNVLQPNRVAIGNRLGHQVPGDGGARAGPVFDKDGLSNGIGHFCSDGARQHIGDAAGGKAHHHLDRLSWVVRLRMGT